MAAERVGGALLSGFISVVLERLVPGDAILEFFRGNKDLVKLLDKLRIELNSANELLSDAEEKQLSSQDVKNWLNTLTRVIYRADYLMDKIDAKALQRKIKKESAITTSKIRSYASTFTRKFERSVIGEGKQILKMLKLLLDQKVRLGLREGVPTRSLQRLGTPLVVKESDVVGRQGDVEKIIELLLSDDASGESLSVVPIVGMGGVGKTTLAQLVYKDNRVREHFGLKVWVTVPEEFDVFQITKLIYEEVTSLECITDDVFELQSKMNDVLAGKIFLFVLDHVGNKIYQRWESFTCGFQSGADGSRIIVTTRSEEVALTTSKRVMHKLKLVSDDDCWRIFEKLAFDDSAEATTELTEIGSKIVERCKGLPLAVKLVAGLLRSTSNPEEWRNILNSDIWQFQGIVPALWLSYHFLPPVLKRCFAYCSIFPKDYEFGQSDMKKIILLWMAEGLLTPENGNRMEDVGKAYLQALISRSFFQHSSTNDSAMVMHDIVHDLAMAVSAGEFCSSCGYYDDLSDLGTDIEFYHLSYRKRSDDLMKLRAVSQSGKKKLSSLRTLLALPLSYSFVLEKPISLHELFLRVGRCLRVLSLSQSSITELPDSIGNMKFLRYLDLSETSIKELPDSICTFYNLQTLLLSMCVKLARLPIRFATLVNLRHLDIRGTSLKEMPPQMCEMKSLQTLSDFVLGKNDGWRIKELGELPLLEGSLRISGLDYIVDVKDVLEANLKDKKFLSQLILEWGVFNITSSQLVREVLEALQPHTNLKQLRISRYRGTEFPEWVGDESFCNMVAVELSYCRNVHMVPPLGQLSSLRRLEICNLDGVVSIGNEFCGSSSTTTNHPFQSLEQLYLWGMKSWEKWSFSSDRLGQEGGVFPSLKNLEISGCSKLIVGLSDCHLPSLESIRIWDCDEMVGVFVCQSHQEMDTNAFPSLQSVSVGNCPRLESPLGRQSFLSNLKHLTICREDESAATTTTTSKMMNFFSTSDRAFERSVIDEGKEILRKLDILFGQTSHLGLKARAPTRPLQRLHAPLVVKESDVVGRDGDKKKITELLLSAHTSDNNLSVIPIVGMSGIGKTTLAHLIYKDSRVQQHFDLKVWVTISEEFDVFEITKRICKEVTSQECEIGEVFVLQSKLNEALVGKRFLFVLDDVWNANYAQWESLKSGFQYGAHGSRIIATMRSKDVALTMSKGVMHELKLVSDDDCWRIFEKHAFDDSTDATAELKEIGRKIVERCKGLPLAVKSVAGLLRSTSNAKEWEKVLKSDIWLKNNIVPALWLSYHFLPPALKRCFAYCSIFPKDYEFGESDTEKIILLWMAEGLLTPEDGERMEDVGKTYLQTLISRSFFQQSSTKKSAMVMHDLVHDLAMAVSAGKFCYSCGYYDDLSDLGTDTEFYHLSYRKRSDDLMKLGAVSQSGKKKLSSLRTLLALPLSYSFVLEKPISFSLHELFLKVGRCLRVLSLSQSSITELPDSIGNMKFLRYLDLSETSIKELPDSICTIYNLQTLLLSCCRDLERLPTRLAALVKLRHLDIRGTSLEEMPPQMGKMKSLQTLSDFVLGKNDSWRIKELGEFPLLEGSLRISGLDYIVDVKDVSEANLKDKKFLSELILEWHESFDIIDSQHEREVLEALQPHTNLKQLRINGYRGTIFPDWVGHESFCNMVAVELLYCTNVCMVPPLGQLSSLRRLEICNLDGVVSIGNEFCSYSSNTNHPFQSLEQLYLWGMKSWKEWSFSSDRLGQEGGVFPSLKNLEISGCRKLIVGLSDCHLPSLESIRIWNCNEMVGVFVCQSHQEVDTNSFPSLQSMSVGKCPRLESLLGRQSFLSNLKHLTIRMCKRLWENRMNLGLPSLMTLSLDLREIEEEVDSFPEEGLLPTTLTDLSIEDFEKLKGLNGRAFQHLTSLQILKIWGCGELECFPKEGLPLSLSYLSIRGCPLLKQRCQRGIGEDWPIIQHIANIEIR